MTDGKIRLAHGAGGPAMRGLIQSVFLRGIKNPEALSMGDGAVVPLGAGPFQKWLVLTTDSHVVQPVVFPGGDIGRLSVCGVVNDLAMMGATEVLGLTSAVVIEEGFSIELLHQLHDSALRASSEAKAPILTGDTKVMRRGELDGILFSTSGLGLADRVVRDSGLEVGDVLIVTGTVGDHGLAVLAARHGLGLQADDDPNGNGGLRSDVAPINGLVREALSAVGESLHAMKDPTRGGVIGALGEMAEKSNVALRLWSSAIPLSDPARAAAELLGIDPLIVANEGKALMGVKKEAADTLLSVLHRHPLGRHAACIGQVEAGTKGALYLDTGFGTRRLYVGDADPLPRIC